MTNFLEGNDRHYSTRSKQGGTYDNKNKKHHIISIDTNNMKSVEKDKINESSTLHPTDGRRTCGRWTSEEHNKFVEALKKYGKQWKKVEDYIQTRSGAQIRSHAQKYFLKIQREYPDQDPYEIFRNNSPEFLEDIILMKNKGESDDVPSNGSHNIRTPNLQQMNENKEEENEKEVVEDNEDDEKNEFSNSVKKMLNQKKAMTQNEEPVPNMNPHLQDILHIRNFYDHVKNVLPNNLPTLNQVASSTSKNL